MDIFSVTLEKYGSIELLFNLLEDNAITINDDVSEGLEYTVNESLKTVTNFQEPLISITPKPLDYIVQGNQNIFDVAIMKFGTLENTFDMLEDNGLEISNSLNAGMSIIVDNYQKGLESVKRLNLQVANGGLLPPDDILIWSSGNPIIYSSITDFIIHK